MAVQGEEDPAAAHLPGHAGPGALDAVAFAHAQGVAHHDLKEGNILLSSTTAKLADLGSANPLALDASSATR